MVFCSCSNFCAFWHQLLIVVTNFGYKFQKRWFAHMCEFKTWWFDRRNSSYCHFFCACCVQLCAHIFCTYPLLVWCFCYIYFASRPIYLTSFFAALSQYLDRSYDNGQSVGNNCFLSAGKWRQPISTSTSNFICSEVYYINFIPMLMWWRVSMQPLHWKTVDNFRWQPDLWWQGRRRKESV